MDDYSYKYTYLVTLSFNKAHANNKSYYNFYAWANTKTYLTC